MGKRLERFRSVGILDEMNGFGLDFIEKTESGFRSTTPDTRTVLKERRNTSLMRKLSNKFETQLEILTSCRGCMSKKVTKIHPSYK